MARYVLRRCAWFLVGLALTSVVVFAALRVLPGDAAQVMGGLKATPGQLAEIRARYGLDQPLVEQYWDWVSGLLRGDLGTSLVTGVPISGQLVEKFAVTLPLAGLSLALGVALGVTAGLAAALRHRHWDGVAVNALAQAVAAIPVVWAALLLIIVFGRGGPLLGLLPSQGFPLDGWDQPGAAFASLVLPAVAVALVEGAAVLRFVRSAMLEAGSQDYVRTQAALGLTQKAALVRRGLPNAGLAILSVIGLQAAGLIVGVVVMEEVFALPGLGSMLVDDVGNRDLVKVQSTILVLVGLVLAIGLAVDLAGRAIDPRLRQQPAAKLRQASPARRRPRPQAAQASA
ncbi:MAG: ABC transporter permease [Bifidobacteriaceae bacterium]|jgi:peptide/nickel transport system permease protein|nr:ABC transporter permease [Bifidobacteriaceae bacterium]